MQELQKDEVWKAIPGTDGMYEVSSLGRARSYRVRGGTSRLEMPVILAGRSGNRKAKSVQFINKEGRLEERSIIKLVRELFTPSVAKPEEITVKPTKVKTVQVGVKIAPRVPTTKLVSSNEDFTMVAVEEVPTRARKQAKNENVYTRMLDDFVKSEHKVVKVSRPGVKDHSVGNELRIARKKHPRKFGKVVVNSYSGLGVFLSRKD